MTEPSTAAARALSGAGRHDAAAKHIVSLLAASPEDAGLHAELASELFQAGRYEEAGRSADESIRIDPRAEWPYRIKSLALIRLGRFRDALVYAQTGVQIEPMIPFSHLALAEAQLSLGDRGGSSATAERLLTLAPAWSDAHDAMGRSLLLRGKNVLAERSFREALRLDPLSANSLNNLGVSLQRQRRHKEAVESFRDAARLVPGSDLAHRNLRGATSQYLDIFSRVPPAVRMVMILALLPVAAPMILGINAIRVLAWQINKRKLDPVTRAFYDSRLARPSFPWRLFSIVAAAVVAVAALVVIATVGTTNPTAAGGAAMALAVLPLSIVVAGYWMTRSTMATPVRKEADPTGAGRIRALWLAQAGMGVGGLYLLYTTFLSVSQAGVAFNLAAAAGSVFLELALVLGIFGAFRYSVRRMPAIWWLAVALELLTFADDAIVVLAIPQPDRFVQVGLVLQVYLVNGVLSIIVLTLLAKRRLRRWFLVGRYAPTSGGLEAQPMAAGDS